MPDTLTAHVLARLERDDSVRSEVGDLVLAALLGEVEPFLGGDEVTKPDDAAETILEPERAYVQSVTVQGFRGIGSSQKLAFPSGPGLTLVVGRNGSGKSSFAEALELLLTGESQRWSARRSKLWKDGWRNLHEPEVAIAADILIDGKPGPITLSRQWAVSDKLEAGETVVEGPAEDVSFSTLGWDESFATYRPFLSYNELGSMLEEGPARLFDALSSILGLEELVAAADALKSARGDRNKVHKKAKEELKTLQAQLEAYKEERTSVCLNALKGKTWDLELVQTLVTSGEADDDTGLSVLEQLSALEPFDTQSLDGIERSASEHRNAHEAVAALVGTDVDAARRTVGLLQQALDFHTHHGDGDCPICGRASALDPDWRQQAEQTIRELAAKADEAQDASRRLQQAEREMRAWMQPAPESLSRASDVGILADALMNRWKEWLAFATRQGVGASDGLVSAAKSLSSEMGTVRAAAAKELEAREDQWRPIALALAEWLPGARRARGDTDTLKDLKLAEDWIRETATTMRNERFAPIKDQVKDIWELLRTSSNVELEDVSFEGKSTSRRVGINVTVDGAEGAALGVMSQGELHALALSLFLPRATLPASPFRFLFIDDPVQSMDPSRVDGLARVLDRVARERQLVVFTHDDRLPDAVRRQRIKAHMVEVARQEGSVVNLRVSHSPMESYLEDARALVRTNDIDNHVVERVVPGLCRQALEAACIEAIRRRRLAKGEQHDRVEALLEDNPKLLPRLALAMYDDAGRAGDVLKGVGNKFGKWMPDVVQACNKGAHGVTTAVDPGFVDNVQKLGKGIAAL